MYKEKVSWYFTAFNALSLNCVWVQMLPPQHYHNAYYTEKWQGVVCVPASGCWKCASSSLCAYAMVRVFSRILFTHYKQHKRGRGKKKSYDENKFNKDIIVWNEARIRHRTQKHFINKNTKALKWCEVSKSKHQALYLWWKVNKFLERYEVWIYRQ